MREVICKGVFTTFVIVMSYNKRLLIYTHTHLYMKQKGLVVLRMWSFWTEVFQFQLITVFQLGDSSWGHRFPRKPKFSNTVNRISWLTLLKDFCKSMKIHNKWFLCCQSILNGQTLSKTKVFNITYSYYL